MVMTWLICTVREAHICGIFINYIKKTNVRSLASKVGQENRQGVYETLILIAFMSLAVKKNTKMKRACPKKKTEAKPL